MMMRRLIMLAIVAVGVPVNAWAGYQDLQPTTEEDASLAQCAQVQPVVQKLIDGASMRLEEARQSNSAVALRAAVDDFESTLRDLRAQLVPCAKTQVIDPHTGHVMPNTRAPAANPVKPPTVSEPHAEHARAAPRKPGTSKKPAPVKPPANSPSPDPHAAHGTPPVAQAEAVVPSGTSDVRIDPVCGLKVDPASAPSARHNGHVYYFCSEQHRQSFEQNPARYLPKKE